MDPFPELEEKLCYKILSKMNISHLTNLDKADVTQEILLSLLEDQEAWFKLREKSYNTTLIYTSLQNKILNFLDKTMTASDLSRHSYKQAATEVYRQLKSQEGNVWETYNSLSEAEKTFVKEFYDPNVLTKRKEIKLKLKISDNQAAKASRKVLRSARLDLTYRTLISLSQGDYNV